jgi:hypothetical protein
MLEWIKAWSYHSYTGLAECWQVDFRILALEMSMCLETFDLMCWGFKSCQNCGKKIFM